MNIYKLTNTGPTPNYDYFCGCIVVAESDLQARLIHPTGVMYPDGWGNSLDAEGDWAPNPEFVNVELIGVAIEGRQPGVVLTDFFNG